MVAPAWHSKEGRSERLPVHLVARVSPLKIIASDKGGRAAGGMI
jgi:hypothetical protein